MSTIYSDRPVIVIGMHRSGTSILCKILCDLGLFAGVDQSKKNHESYFFVQINSWLFKQCGAAWDRPFGTRDLFANQKVYNLCNEHVRRILASPFSANYLGRKSPNGLFSVDRVWGWKDPRSTFTLPLWLDLFPNARVLNVTRNGVDVANSLKVREDARLKKQQKALEAGDMLCKHQMLQAKLTDDKMKRVIMSLRCQTLEGGLSLWEEYMAEALKHVDRLGQQAMNVCYEELLAKPETILNHICTFCNLDITDAMISAAAGKFKRSRANAYLNDSGLVRFAQENRERIERF